MKPVSSDAAARGDYDIARRTLRLLAERKTVPTPEAYAEAWREVAGTPTGDTPLAALRLVLKELVRSHRLTREEALAAIEAAQSQAWGAVVDLIERALKRREPGSNWPQMMVTMLKACDQIHPGWTRARKLDAVTRVAESGAETPELALERLTRLIDSWSSAPEPAAPADSAEPPRLPPVLPVPLAPPALDGDAEREIAQWKALALRSLSLLEAALPDGALARSRAIDVLQELRAAGALPDGMGPRLIDLGRVVERETEEQARVRAGLARLLALLCDNMKTLAPDEAWLAGQLEPIRALLAGPIGSDALTSAEQTLAQVIAQQAMARRGLAEAKVALREMLGTLIERIGMMSDSAGHYYERVDNWAHKLEQAEDFGSLSRIVQGLLADTSEVRGDIQRARHELNESRRRVDEYEQRVRELERELLQISSLVQRDPLTGALNRRGLEEAFAVESARAARYDASLALLMIDLDRFKALNDSLGHVAGDRALVHLVTVMMASLRPTDAIARIGGEEFAVLLPGSGLSDALLAGTRLQHELVERPFEVNGAPHPLTFSAGVSQWQFDEPLEALLDRADMALYRAKHEGRDRVEAEQRPVAPP
ncbi:MAG: diguanylate cyclase [Burkholderiaceae bacterium]